MKNVVVIGGGPAGMMAAIASARNQNHVCLLEQNEKLGKKLFITGKGRCNVTNACEAETFFEMLSQNSKFMYSAYYGFDNGMVMDFFESTGCKLKVERGNRVFPVSDHSSDVIKALTKELQRLQVEVRLQTKVAKILYSVDASDEKKVCKVQLKDKTKLDADCVIVATGGKSYPSTGSTGDGYRFAEEAGHEVTELYPALVPFLTKESWVKKLQGLSLKNVTLTVVTGGKKVFCQQGEMLFTHQGISGPLVLSASSVYAKKPLPSMAMIDLKPALSEEQLHKRLIREFEENNNKCLKNILPSLYPSSLVEIMMMLAEVNADKKANEISKVERERLVTITKNLPLTITGTADFEEAIITHGGVKLKQINPSTMESKVIKGLYFAGEVLDLDAVTGGYNLQIAWSTGHLAGESIGME